MLKALLQGRPVSHPLHPMLVHLPIGLFFLSFLLDLISLGPGGMATVQAAFYAMAGGVATALLAAATGLADWSDIRGDHPGKWTATAHMVLNVGAVALYGVNLWLRLPALDSPTPPLLPVLLSLVGVGLLCYSGYLGGELVYRDGVGVGRHRYRGRLPRETVWLSSDGAPDRFVEVPGAGRLEPGQALRVDLDGEVLALARLEDGYFAFQEFCPHRYGPLSEGAIRDGQVECPWHRSCFDVRTGEAVAGPADVDLKTWQVDVRDGKVFVRGRES